MGAYYSHIYVKKWLNVTVDSIQRLQFVGSESVLILINKLDRIIETVECDRAFNYADRAILYCLDEMRDALWALCDLDQEVTPKIVENKFDSAKVDASAMVIQYVENKEQSLGLA